ncbi:MAG: hypothetical protein QW561_03000 [Candidatus Aenigmatarchaeota archaeon]
MTHNKQQWQKILKQCQSLLRSIERNFTRTIEFRLKFGKLLLEVAGNKLYGAGVVKKLAENLSQLLGYNICPQRLYEYMKVAKTFTSPDEIYEAAGTRDLTWSDILRLCRIKKPKNLMLVITLSEEKDSDLIKYRILPHSERNDFLKQALRLGIATFRRTRRLPGVVNSPSVIVFRR